jgi:hypothetical protein
LTTFFTVAFERFSFSPHSGPRSLVRPRRAPGPRGVFLFAFAIGSSSRHCAMHGGQ